MAFRPLHQDFWRLALACSAQNAFPHAHPFTVSFDKQQISAELSRRGLRRQDFEYIFFMREWPKQFRNHSGKWPCKRSGSHYSSGQGRLHHHYIAIHNIIEHHQYIGIHIVQNIQYYRASCKRFAVGVFWNNGAQRKNQVSECPHPNHKDRDDDDEW